MDCSVCSFYHHFRDETDLLVAILAKHPETIALGGAASGPSKA